MRKLFWCGCAAVVVCAASVYWAARWADQNPQTPTTCCGRVAWRLAVEWNPIVRAGRYLGSQLAALVQPRSKQTASVPETVPVCPPDPGETCPPPIVEVIDLSTFAGLRPAVEEAMQPPVVPDAFPVPGFETVYPGGIEETEQAVRAIMPPADEDTQPSKPTCVDQFVELFRECGDEAIWMNAETLPMPRVEDADEEDAEPQTDPTAPEEISMPSEDGAARVIINGEEEFLQTGVDSFDLFGGKPCGEAVEAEPEMLPMPHAEKPKWVFGSWEVESRPELLPMPHENAADEQLPLPPTEEGATEESETSKPGTPADCQEDPDMYKRYPECPVPSCPGMKRCPDGAGLGTPHTDDR